MNVCKKDGGDIIKRHLTLKKALKGLLLDLLYHKCNPLIKTAVDGSIF